MSASRPGLAAIAAAFAIGMLPHALPARAAEPRTLKWADLLPAAAAKPLKPFFNKGPVDIGSVPHDGTPAPAPREEGAWMSGPARSGSSPAPVVTALDGERVLLGGYVVPLDFQATKVKEFLLVPFVGACIHVPPPPANQIVYVTSEQGFEVKGSFDPVYVTGKMSVGATFTGLAEAGYTIAAEKVEMRAGR